MTISTVGSCYEKWGILIYLMVLAIGTCASVRCIAAEQPDLVLVIAVDQLRPDRMDPDLPGGIGRISREGRVYENAFLDHAQTSTCPGHQSILSGRHPARAGIVSNTWIDTDTGSAVYCVADFRDRAAVFNGGEGRSPRLIKVDALGDWMKAARPGTKVFSVSGKDRSAITLAGKKPDASYWYTTGKSGGFTSSRYYLEKLPDWVNQFNGKSPFTDGFASNLPDIWIHEVDDLRVDDYPSESDEYERTSGHPIWDSDPATALSQLMSTPYLDDVTLSFAKKLIIEEQLGGGSGTDLLAIGLSATDLVGHLYGPFSSEAKAALTQLDRSLEDFFTFLENHYGKDRVLVALTSDHGVLPLPEWLFEKGESQCPLPGGRQNVVTLVSRLVWYVYWAFGPKLAVPGSLIDYAGNHISVNRPLAKANNINVDEVVKALKKWLENEPVIRQAWTREEILEGESEMAELRRHSFDPERSGDLEVQLEPTCLIKPGGGTMHGTPYDYDRAVPIAFFGPWFETGSVSEPARTVDIAPTIADILNIPVPADLDGKVLP
jgi:predicted AlkP superfamily pyrophosphatase or phosphodiesterase